MKYTPRRMWRNVGRKRVNPPIKVRWIDINKGDTENPEYRSRLVAKEIKKDSREDLFAATPPLEALKILFRLAMTEGIGVEKGKENEGMKLEFIDNRRAFSMQKHVGNCTWNCAQKTRTRASAED